MRLRNKKGRSDRGRKTLTRGKQRKLDEKKMNQDTLLQSSQKQVEQEKNMVERGN